MLLLSERHKQSGKRHDPGNVCIYVGLQSRGIALVGRTVKKKCLVPSNFALWQKRVQRIVTTRAANLVIAKRSLMAME